jgi:hypothetical protein
MGAAEIAACRKLYVLPRNMPAVEALAAIRAHWSIETQLHWVLDAVFDADHSRTRKDSAPLNLPSCAASPSTSPAQSGKKAWSEAKSNAPDKTTASLRLVQTR